MGKIIGEYDKEENVIDKDPNLLVELIRSKVNANYPQVKRWTKSTDVFDKEFLVIPINAHKHWYCLIVVNPGGLLTQRGHPQILYCDSMFEKRPFIA